jgi:SAM-dependent methyltransferase
MNTFSLEENRKYWGDPNTRSLIDSNLKELEIDFISRYLKEEHEVADIGCGDGNTIVNIASKVKSILGIERSDYLKNMAIQKLAENKIENASICSGDILETDFCEEFDIVITERVLINLPSWELQYQALENIHRSLRVGGLYLMVENTNDGHNALNKLRQAVGLKPIEVHWHNLYLDHEVFCDAIKDKFEILERNGFSLYYFLTRVYTQMFANFTGSGVNAKADKIFELSDPAARALQQIAGDQMIYRDNNNVLGAIQGFALKKI